MVSTSTNNPGKKITVPKSFNDIINNIRNSGYGKIPAKKQAKQADLNEKQKENVAKRIKENAKLKSKSKTQSSSGSSSESQETSAGSGIVTLDDAGGDVLSGDVSSDGESNTSDSSNSSGTSGSVSPLLQGSMSFEELIGEICEGLDLIFIVKRSTVVVTDYESLYAEAKYLRDNYHSSIQNEDMALWQLEEGSYELDVSEYGFYNTVKVHYNKGTITESYDDLVRIYGNVVIEYFEPKIDKSTAIMKAKAYLAAHIRDFDMNVKASVLHDGDIDIGDIVTLENPMTMRDANRTQVEKRDPEYFFVMGNSIQWEGESYIKNDIELRYGAKSPKKLDVPESGSPGYTNSSSTSTGNIESAIDEVGKMASKIKYSGICQTHDCVREKQAGDCWGMSDFISCELSSRGITTRILQYPTSSSSRHRSVQYKNAEGQWENFPYRQYGCNTLFNDTGGVSSGKQVSKNC